MLSIIQNSGIFFSASYSLIHLDLFLQWNNSLSYFFKLIFRLMLPLVRLYISWYFYILIIKPRTYNVSIDSSSSTIYENVSFIDHVSGIRLQDGCIFAINHKKDNDVTIFWHDVIFNCFDVAVFILSSKVTGPSFMSIS